MESKTTNYKKYNSKNKLKIIMIKKFQKKLISLLKDDIKKSSLLDVGCGEGFISNYIYNNTNIKNITGIDYNKDAINYARKINKKIKYKLEDLYYLNYKDESFDIVISLEVLEHLKKSETSITRSNKSSKEKSNYICSK